MYVFIYIPGKNLNTSHKYSVNIQPEKFIVNGEGREINKRRKGGREHQGAGFINEIIPVSTV
jgi:hypothetical protein